MLTYADEAQVMELENHISQLENGQFGLPEASVQIRDLKRELERSNNRISSAMKDLNDAWRKMEDLYEEVRVRIYICICICIICRYICICIHIYIDTYVCIHT